MPPFIEFSDALTIEEVAALNAMPPGEHNNSFTNVEHEDIVRKLTLLAEEANRRGEWGLIPTSKRCTPTDPMIYNRFGPGFSDRHFSWHCDADELDSRLISVVAYLTPPEEFEGGELEMKVGDVVVSKRYGPCYAVAFPSKTLKHRVTPVTKGSRRSLVLICGADSSRSNKISSASALSKDWGIFLGGA
jgi:hypothetical protein